MSEQFSPPSRGKIKTAELSRSCDKQSDQRQLSFCTAKTTSNHNATLSEIFYD